MSVTDFGITSLLGNLDGAAEVYPDAHWPTQIAEALRGLIHEANVARDQCLKAIPAAVKNELITRFRDGVLVGLSATTTHGTRPGERKARLLLEVLRDREADVLRFAHDLKGPPTSNQAERDLRPSKVQQNVSGRLTSENRTQDRYSIRGVRSTAAKLRLTSEPQLGSSVLVPRGGTFEVCVASSSQTPRPQVVAGPHGRIAPGASHRMLRLG